MKQGRCMGIMRSWAGRQKYLKTWDMDVAWFFGRGQNKKKRIYLEQETQGLGPRAQGQVARGTQGQGRGC